MLATATLLTLLANSTDELFRPLLIEDLGVVDRHAIVGTSLFFLARNHLLLAKLLSIVVLVLVIVGWRPRLTALPHWWISYSFAASASIIDGGDQVASTLSLLLVPVALGDRRTWHWDAPEKGSYLACVAAETGLLLIRVQVAVIYLFAAVLKFPTEEWANGTALYYWWTHPKFGAWGPFRWLTDRIGQTLLVVPITWGVLVLELSLALALLAPTRFRTRLLPIALFFHLGIAFIHGMPSFALTMSAALVLYLWPTWRPFPLPALPRHPVPRTAPAAEHVSVAP